ncbi:MAG: SEC-C domain-containing protein [Deltaproteobacteria bacterium]|nr:SEC-C domain-containing protein [Deltaproteobacteria bacterium]
MEGVAGLIQNREATHPDDERTGVLGQVVERATKPLIFDEAFEPLADLGVLLNELDQRVLHHVGDTGVTEQVHDKAGAHRRLHRRIVDKFVDHRHEESQRPSLRDRLAGSQDLVESRLRRLGDRGQDGLLDVTPSRQARRPTEHAPYHVPYLALQAVIGGRSGAAEHVTPVERRPGLAGDIPEERRQPLGYLGPQRAAEDRQPSLLPALSQVLTELLEFGRLVGEELGHPRLRVVEDPAAEFREQRTQGGPQPVAAVVPERTQLGHGLGPALLGPDLAEGPLQGAPRVVQRERRARRERSGEASVRVQLDPDRLRTDRVVERHDFAGGFEAAGSVEEHEGTGFKPGNGPRHVHRDRSLGREQEGRGTPNGSTARRGSSGPDEHQQRHHGSDEPQGNAAGTHRDLRPIRRHGRPPPSRPRRKGRNRPCTDQAICPPFRSDGGSYPPQRRLRMVRAGFRGLHRPSAVAGSESAKPGDPSRRGNAVDLGEMMGEPTDDVKRCQAPVVEPRPPPCRSILPATTVVVRANGGPASGLFDATFLGYGSVPLRGGACMVPKASPGTRRPRRPVASSPATPTPGSARGHPDVAARSTSDGALVVRTTPSASRQLAERGPLVFWRDGVDGLRQGLACVVETCKNPECTCRDALIHAIEIDEFTVTVEAADHDTALRTTRAGMTDPPTGRTVARLNIDSGEVVPDPKRPDDALVAWIREEADGELLDLLQRRWLRGKNRDPEEMETDIGPEDWAPGEKLIYGLAFPNDRDDLFAIDDRLLLACEFFCVDPTCDCGEVEILFEEYEPCPMRKRPRTVAWVQVRIADGKGVVEPETPADRDVASRLWVAYRVRHRVVDRLTERQRRMQDVGRVLLARLHATGPPPATPAPLVGRNDPCPCGSGKKFKRCHGE